MSTSIIVPRLGVGMTEGTLSSWLVPDGATVKAGEAIYTIETDKVESEIEAPVAGVLHQIGEEGETYDVGTLLGEID
ncbi:MAG TPA: lipoyl domain-containing protein [Acidimicrobiales bacterium]|jgi:pyruvate/2-oxoglutarate dehydrogenase complex dihydrolipoamide acyltransferase (E2) component|nr:lipoyl domain-containing protein [Acidimicrobiales bacterium]